MKNPTGYIAICQHKKVIGAMNIGETITNKQGIQFGRWLSIGCILKPRFANTWSIQVESCKCLMLLP